jgi:hypothetical protein
MAKSWKPEVIADSSGEWCGNGLRFATEEEARNSASDLAMRWIAAREWRAAESDDPVNYTYHDRQLRRIEGAEG